MKKFFAFVLVIFLIISNFTACELKDDLIDTDNKDSTFEENETEHNKTDTDTKTNPDFETETKESEDDFGTKTESVSDLETITLSVTETGTVVDDLTENEDSIDTSISIEVEITTGADSVTDAGDLTENEDTIDASTSIAPETEHVKETEPDTETDTDTDTDTETETETETVIITEAVTETESDFIEETQCLHFDFENDGDHMCEYCQSVISDCVDNDINHSCDDCNETIGAHQDSASDGDHNCDYCKEVLTQCFDLNNDLLCDECLSAYYSKGLIYTKTEDESGYILSGIGSCTDSSIAVPQSYEGLPVVEIGSSAFYNCDMIKRVIIPASVDVISMSTFNGCAKLTEIIIVESNPVYKTIDGNIYSKDGTILLRYATGKTDDKFVIPQGVTEIGEYAFATSTYLTDVVISNGVKVVGGYAFQFCRALSNITIANSVERIGAVAFYETAYYMDRSNWDNNELYINNCLIVGSAEVYTIKDGTRIIADGACSNDNTIYSVTIPDSVKFIGNNAFYNCSRMTQIKIGDGVEIIGSYAFNSCIDLKSITIGSGVKEIKKGAFYNCNLLSDVYYAGDIASWCNIDFENADSNPILNRFHIKNPNGTYSVLKTLWIPETVTEIKSYAFYRCYSITSLRIPESVVVIADNAFKSCDALTEVEFISTEGWSVAEQLENENVINIPSSDIVDQKVAAGYLTGIYCNYYWVRKTA